jgi:hypothetical protein
MFSVATQRAFQAWLAEHDAAACLNCIVSGSVLLPRLAPGSDPANPGEDTVAWSPEDRRFLLQELGRWVENPEPRRFLLLSGDYHLAAAMELVKDGRPLGAAIVAPPLYAPLSYANSPGEALWTNEDLRAWGLSPHAIGSWPGSGFTTLHVAREGQLGFRVTMNSWLQDHGAGAAKGSVVGPVSILLP